MGEEEIELPREPKEDQVETVASDIIREGTPNSPVLLLTGEGTTVYVPGWGITREY